MRVCAGASLTIRSLHVQNDGWQFDQLSQSVLKSASCPEVLRIRGYTLRKNGGRTIVVTQPGAWLVEDGVLHMDGSTAGSGGQRGAPQHVLSQQRVGGAIFGEVPPPPNGTWSSSSLSLAPGSTMRVPLVLGAPSRVTLEVEPHGGGLHLSLLPEVGPPVLLPTYVSPSPSSPSNNGEGGGGEGGDVSGGGGSGAQVRDVHVDGSGVFSVALYNPSLFTPVGLRASHTTPNTTPTLFPAPAL